MHGAFRAEDAKRRGEHHRAGRQQLGTSLVDPGKGQALGLVEIGQLAREVIERIEPKLELVQRGRRRGPPLGGQQPGERSRRPPGGDAERALESAGTLTRRSQ